MDPARQHLDEEIARTESTRSMLTHLADAIENGPRGRETYQGDAIEALLHGAEIAERSIENLEHVAEIYDAKVAVPVPPPGGTT
jgi:hypothetical protein